MALSKATLKSGLQSSMEGYPSSAGDAAQGWATAIVNHVSTGVSPQGVPPTSASIAANRPSLVAAITSAFQASSGDGAAPAVASAVSTLYLGLLFVGQSAGHVVSVPGSATLPAALLAAFRDNTESSASMSEAAGRIADAIHACTITVLVEHVAPHYVLGPLT